jgi:hypothetical protein
MYTAIALVALTVGVTSGKVAPNPAWLGDYKAAQIRVIETGKPMAVFVASGKDGWNSVARDGITGPALARLLSEKFVCGYADTNTSAGRSLATALDNSGSGLVISDRSRNYQAYSRTGILNRDELIKALEAYADAKEVTRTETVGTELAFGCKGGVRSGCGGGWGGGFGGGGCCK